MAPVWHDDSEQAVVADQAPALPQPEQPADPQLAEPRDGVESSRCDCLCFPLLCLVRLVRWLWYCCSYFPSADLLLAPDELLLILVSLDVIYERPRASFAELDTFLNLIGKPGVKSVLSDHREKLQRRHKQLENLSKVPLQIPITAPLTPPEAKLEVSDLERKRQLKELRASILKELRAEDDQLLKAAGVLRSYYRFLADFRWNLVLGIWGLFLSVVVGVVAGLIIAKLS